MATTQRVDEIHTRKRRRLTCLYDNKSTTRTSTNSVDEISNLISQVKVNEVEWLAGALIRWLSSRICNSKSELYAHLPGQEGSDDTSVWELVCKVMEFLHQHRVVTSIPVQIGRVLLRCVGSCSTPSQVSIATRIYRILTVLFQPGLEENAKLFQVVYKNGLHASELICEIVRGHDRLVRRHGNPRKCFVATVRPEFLGSLIRVWCSSSVRLRESICTLFSSALMHRDVLDGYASACTATLFPTLSRKKKKNKKKTTSGVGNTNTNTKQSFQRKLFDTLSTLCSKDENMKSVLPTLLQLACTAYDNEENNEENKKQNDVPFQVKLYLEFASLASTTFKVQSQLLAAFLDTSPSAASQLRRSDRTAELMRKAFEPYCLSAVNAVPNPCAVETIRMHLRVTHLLVEPHLDTFLPSILETASSSIKSQDICCELLDVYSRLRQLDRWILVKIKASNSKCFDLGSEYDKKFAMAVAKCSESQIPLILETMKGSILRCDPMTTYVMKRLVSNCHISNITAKEIRNKVEGVIGMNVEMNRALVVLRDRCNVFLGLDPFVPCPSSSVSFPSSLKTRYEIAQALDSLCRERQRRLQSRFSTENSVIVDIESHVTSLWDNILSGDGVWASVRSLIHSLQQQQQQQQQTNKNSLQVLTAVRLDTLCYFTKSSSLEQKARDFLQQHIFNPRNDNNLLLHDAQFYEITTFREHFLNEICTRLKVQKQQQQKYFFLINLICKLPHEYFRDQDIVTIINRMLDMICTMKTTTTTTTQEKILRFCANRPIVTLRIICSSSKTRKSFLQINQVSNMLLREMARAGGVISSADSELQNILSYLVKKKHLHHLANMLIGLDEGISERAQIRLDKSLDADKLSLDANKSTTMTCPLIDTPLLSTLEEAEQLCVHSFSNDSFNNSSILNIFSSLLSIRWNISMDKNTNYNNNNNLLDLICPMFIHAATITKSSTIESKAASSRYFMAVCKTQRHLKIPLDRSFLTRLIVSMLQHLKEHENDDDDDLLYRSFEYLYKGLSLTELRFLFNSFFSEMEVENSRRNLIAARCIVRLFRAPSLKGERAKYVSTIAMSSLCRLEMTTRRHCDDEKTEFRALLSNMLVSVLSRSNTFRLYAHDVSICLQKVIYLSSFEDEDISPALIAAVQYRPRQICCCLAVYISLIQHVLSRVFTSTSVVDPQLITTSIRHLQRICELLVQNPVRDAFRHHVVHLLSHYLSLVVRRDSPLSVNHEKSMMFVVANMFDVCSKHELQQLHIVLDPPRRALMKSLHKKYLKEFKYSGNV